MFSATLLPPSTFTQAFVCAGASTETCDGVLINNSGSLNNVFRFNESGTTATLAVQLTGQSGYGVLRAFSSSTLSTSPSFFGVQANTFERAGFQEQLRVDFAPFTGQIGYMVMSATITGNLSGTTNAGAQLAVNCGTRGPTIPTTGCRQFSLFAGGFGGNPPVVDFSGIYTFPQAFPFRYGDWFNLVFQLTAGTNGTGPLYAAVTDASNTFVLSGLSILGPDMTPVNGATFTSGSGTVYGPNGVVPEPSSLVLVGLGGLLFVRRVRRLLTPVADG